MITILTVCTGNICRSPYAERFLQKELNGISPDAFLIRSAGAHALVGHEMDERTASKLSEAGGTSEGFRARQITSEMTADFDLVLALSEEHRNKIVSLSPRLLKRTYTVREFAAVIQEVTANPHTIIPRGSSLTAVGDRWSALIKAAPMCRHAARQSVAGHMDVTDPYRQGDHVYDRMVVELLPALQSIIEFERFHACEL